MTLLIQNWAHGDFGNSLDEVGTEANNYLQLAIADSLVIGVIGYYWPNGFEFAEAVGARGMPQEIKEEYIRFGSEITGK